MFPTIAIRSVGIEFATSVARRDVELCQVTNTYQCQLLDTNANLETHTRHLNKVWRFDKVDTLDGAVGYQARTIAALHDDDDKRSRLNFAERR